jgi:multiple antibiotic resistance protein
VNLHLSITPVEAVPGFISLLAMFSPPATVAVAIAAGGRYPTWRDLGVLSLVIAAMVPVVAATFLAAGPVTTRLSAGAQDVLARLSGIILVALALQLLVEGFTRLFAATPYGAALLGPPGR